MSHAPKNDKNHATELSPHEIASESEDIIDYPAAKKLFGGNEEVLNKVLHTFMQGLPTELTHIEEAYRNNDWIKIHAGLHKLIGGASYCGTKRLLTACKKLDSYLKTNETSLRDTLYQSIIAEITLLKEYFLAEVD